MEETEKAISRRKLLSSLFYAAGKNAAEALGATVAPYKPRDRGGSERKLPPPGSVPERLFEGLCDGCGDCAAACPFDCIKLSRGEHPRAYIEPEQKPCRLCQSLPCIAACARGALAAPESAWALRMGLAEISDHLCTARGGADCRLCAVMCPLEPKGIFFDESGPVVDRARCTGCGICAEACSTVNNISAVTISKR